MIYWLARSGPARRFFRLAKSLFRFPQREQSHGLRQGGLAARSPLDAG
jgi:hypothetical protein